MTPHEMINLPYAGQANRYVKAYGFWRETLTDTERIEWIEERGATIHMGDDGDFIIIPRVGEIYGVLRQAIDQAATKQTSRDFRGYMED